MVRKATMRSSSRTFLPLCLLAAMALSLTGSAGASGAFPQQPPPYGLFVANDCEVKTEYAPGTRSTVVQLMLTPPGPGGSASAATLVLRAERTGADASAPAGQIEVIGIPAINSNPNIIRNLELELVIARAASQPLRLFYVGNGWEAFGFSTPGNEITRASFKMSAADVQALLLAEKVTGRVMNYPFEFTPKHLAALRVFAMAAGIPVPDDKLSK
jgi:hypothetical protein